MSNKISEELLLDYVGEVGEFEKEHRKYSSFYCSVSHTITQEDVDALAADGFDASTFLNVHVERQGTWDDSWGTEWDDTSYSLVESYEEIVPEVVIPAHTVIKYRTSPFTPEFPDE